MAICAGQRNRAVSWLRHRPGIARASPTISTSGCSARQTPQFQARQPLIVYQQGFHTVRGISTVAATRPPSRFFSLQTRAAPVQNAQALARVLAPPAWLRAPIPRAAPVFSTSITSASFSIAARNQQLAAFLRRRDPVLERAFSTSICSSIGGNRNPAGFGLDSPASRAAGSSSRTRFQRQVIRYHFQSPTPAGRVIQIAVQVVAQDVGEPRESYPAPTTGFSTTSARMELRQLNRKCGLTLRFQCPAARPRAAPVAA